MLPLAMIMARFINDQMKFVNIFHTNFINQLDPSLSNQRDFVACPRMESIND